MQTQPIEDRVRRDLRRQDLALRMIRHEVRTHTIRLWTGLADATIHRLSQCVQDASRVRPRGPAPSHIGRFVRTEQLRSEAATVAGMCYVLQVLPPRPLADARRVLPSLARGERLCEAYERFQMLVPHSELTLEQVIGLVLALAQGTELALTHCVDCGAAVLLDKLGFMRRRCGDCERKAARAGRAEGSGETEGREDEPIGGIRGLSEPGGQRRLFR